MILTLEHFACSNINEHERKVNKQAKKLHNSIITLLQFHSVDISLEDLRINYMYYW